MIDLNPHRIVSLLQQGGPIVLALAVLSVAALTVTLLKAAQFIYLGVGRDRSSINIATRQWRAGNHDVARKQIAQQNSTIGKLVKTAMSADSASHSGARTATLIREDIESQALAHLAGLRSYLRILEAASQLAPLIGLFGTVVGMMAAFKALQSAGAEADPTALAGGIWTALTTTAVGLAVAIPAALALYWFEGRLAREQTLIETAVTRVLTAPPNLDTTSITGDQDAAH